MERKTRQRDAVLTALVMGRCALTPPEICELAQQTVPHLSLSTVYRLLKGLQDEHKVSRVDLPGQPARYEAEVKPRHKGCDDHHHHFHCNRCDRVYPIHACPGSMKQLVPRGFRVEAHEITLHGRCPQCVAPAASP